MSNCTKEPVETSAAPAAIGPYSQAVAAGNWIFLSGQLGLDPATGGLVAGGTVAEARQALANLRAVLRAAGADLADVVRTTIYLVDLNDFAAVNDVYAATFSPPYPARVTVGVASLPRGARIEIEAVAFRRHA
ncbi:MAG: reactive intermediate/imine deaminase [Candidatus Binatia bacterium]|nr:MAG: reactive intermediate/imine deaminase [Candidatus Binatia bacterium]